MTTRARALAGAAVWVVFTAATVRDLRAGEWAHSLLLLAVLVVVPAALELQIRVNRSAGAERIAGGLMLPAGLLLAFSLWLSSGTGAAALAVPWLAVTVLLAGAGLQGVVAAGRERRTAAQWCDQVARLFGAVGGAWTFADRAGIRPLGFDPTIVALTAVHFHYAGIILPILTARCLESAAPLRVGAAIAAGVLTGVPAVAVGITATQLGATLWIEFAAGWWLALSAIAVGALHVRLAIVADAGQPASVRVAWAVAGVSLVFGMVLAGLYASRALDVPLRWLSIPWMRALHGSANALGFALIGVWGWSRVVGRARA